MLFCCCRFDNIRLELDDVNECFELIKNLVLDTPAEPYFLSGRGRQTPPADNHFLSASRPILIVSD
jgi:hypothetical protein